MVAQRTLCDIKKTLQPELNNFSLDLLFNFMDIGVILLDEQGKICYLNKTVGHMLERDIQHLLAKHFTEVFSTFFSVSAEDYRKTSPMFEVMAHNVEKIGVERYSDLTKRCYLTNYHPVMLNNLRYYLVTFTDITKRKNLEEEIIKMGQELDAAFALTLPNSKVEYKLKNTPEYVDTYNPDQGEITVTEIIPDGGYRHVVNALKIAGDLHREGAMSILGIDKDLLVQTLIFHDIGKSQPDLAVGQRVIAEEIFEDSKLHARRSAEIAQHIYQKPLDMCTLIHYHHHAEDELPASFPRHLLPMLRLVKLIDGLSAALTRRKAQIKLAVHKEVIMVEEKNQHPAYNNKRSLNLFTGQVKYLP
ncbi:hypothetical protein JCM39194_10110 [Desulfotomaculum varum]